MVKFLLWVEAWLQNEWGRWNYYWDLKRDNPDREIEVLKTKTPGTYIVSARATKEELAECNRTGKRIKIRLK